MAFASEAGTVNSGARKMRRVATPALLSNDCYRSAPTKEECRERREGPALTEQGLALPCCVGTARTVSSHTDEQADLRALGKPRAWRHDS